MRGIKSHLKHEKEVYITKKIQRELYLNIANKTQQLIVELNLHAFVYC